MSGLAVARVNWSTVMVRLARVAPSGCGSGRCRSRHRHRTSRPLRRLAGRQATRGDHARGERDEPHQRGALRVPPQRHPSFVEPRLSAGIAPSEGDETKATTYDFTVEIPVDDSIFGTEVRPVRATTPVHRDPDTTAMSKLSKRDSTLLILIGVIALIGGIFWFYVKPARADLTAKKQAAQEAQTKVDDLQSQLHGLTAQASRPRKVALADELLLAKAYPLLRGHPGAHPPDRGAGQAVRRRARRGDLRGVDGLRRRDRHPVHRRGDRKYLDVQDFLYRMHNRVNVDASGKLHVKGRMLAVTKADLTPKTDSSTSGSSTSNSSGKVSASITIVAFSRTAGGAGGAAAAPSTNSGGTS